MQLNCIPLWLCRHTVSQALALVLGIMFVVYLSFVHKASDFNLNFTNSRNEHPIHGQKLWWTVLPTLPQNLQYLCYCAVTKVHKRRTRWRKKDWSRETKRRGYLQAYTHVPATDSQAQLKYGSTMWQGGEISCYWQGARGNQSCAPRGDKGGDGRRGWSGQRRRESTAEAEGFLPAVLTLNWARSQWRQARRVSFDISVA